MFKRKLLSLGHGTPDAVNVSDEKQFRNLVVWLEDQKIRHFKIEDRAGLRSENDSEWTKAFENYLTELGCPYPPTKRNSLTDWLLGYAVRLEYGDNVDKYKDVTAQTLGASVRSPPPAGTSSNPLDNLNFSDPDFKAGVASLALLLQVPPYEDHLEQLKAICIIVKERLTKEALEFTKKQNDQGEVIPIDQLELGFDTGDYIINEAAKILRLLHVRDLREFQTNINQAIVAVQTLTANPKTDTRLGKVGRM